MTKQEFLKRCETIYDMGLVSKETLSVLSCWTDAMLRLEGGQFSNFCEFLITERKRTDNFASHKTLANDVDGYKVIQMVAVLCHPCQFCAEDKDAWHTRSAFCEHKNKL